MTVNVSLSVSVSSMYRPSSMHQMTVIVASSFTELVSLSATGASLTAVTFTVIVLAEALSASPSFTVKSKVV